MKILHSTFLFLMLSFGTVVFAQPAGKEVCIVSGHVLTQDGNAVSEANVYLFSMERVARGRPATVKTDEHGFFEVRLKEPGEYAVHAFKPESGYPDILFAFDLAPDQVPPPRITLSKGQHLTGLKVRLGAKSGVIHFQVLDARTGQPITTADYKLCQMRAPKNCVNSRAIGPFDASVPATEISVDISSNGYLSTTYKENDQPFLAVKPGEERTLLIKLAPKE